MAAKETSKKASEPKDRYIVTQQFRDIVDFDVQHNVGDDVSNFDQRRLDELVEGGLVKKESSLKDDE
jgi:hypothetical protein